jgi:hypothetical protein
MHDVDIVAGNCHCYAGTLDYGNYFAHANSVYLMTSLWYLSATTVFDKYHTFSIFLPNVVLYVYALWDTPYSTVLNRKKTIAECSTFYN